MDGRLPTHVLVGEDEWTGLTHLKDIQAHVAFLNQFGLSYDRTNTVVTRFACAWDRVNNEWIFLYNGKEPPKFKDQTDGGAGPMRRTARRSTTRQDIGPYVRPQEAAHTKTWPDRQKKYIQYNRDYSMALKIDISREIRNKAHSYRVDLLYKMTLENILLHETFLDDMTMLNMDEKETLYSHRYTADDDSRAQQEAKSELEKILLKDTKEEKSRIDKELSNEYEYDVPILHSDYTVAEGHEWSERALKYMKYNRDLNRFLKITIGDAGITARQMCIDLLRQMTRENINLHNYFYVPRDELADEIRDMDLYMHERCPEDKSGEHKDAREVLTKLFTAERNAEKSRIDALFRLD